VPEFKYRWTKLSTQSLQDLLNIYLSEMLCIHANPEKKNKKNISPHCQAFGVDGPMITLRDCIPCRSGQRRLSRNFLRLPPRHKLIDITEQKAFCFTTHDFQKKLFRSGEFSGGTMAAEANEEIL
jgi:hypothetical protein